MPLAIWVYVNPSNPLSIRSFTIQGRGSHSESACITRLHPAARPKQHEWPSEGHQDLHRRPNGHPPTPRRPARECRLPIRRGLQTGWGTSVWESLLGAIWLLHACTFRAATAALDCETLNRPGLDTVTYTAVAAPIDCCCMSAAVRTLLHDVRMHAMPSLFF